MQQQRFSMSAAVVVTLALCCGHAFASPPTNLTAVLGDASEHGDYVDVKVQWGTATGCWPTTPYYDVYLTAEGGKKEHIGWTYDTNMNLTKVEYWTNYTVALETSRCWFTKTVHTQIFTGPGNPHKVSAVDTAPSKTAVNITITEAASMPRIVDQYNLTACNDRIHKCKTVFIPRNGEEDELETTIGTVMDGLEAQTLYNLSVVPVIHDEQTNTNKEKVTEATKVYTGEEFRTQFTTSNFKFPIPEQFTIVQTENEDFANVTVSWKLPHVDDLVFAFFNLSMRDAKGHLEHLGVTNESSVVLEHLPFFTKLSLEVTPVFNFTSRLQSGTTGIFNFIDADMKAPANVTLTKRTGTSLTLQISPPKALSPAEHQVFTVSVDSKKGKPEVTKEHQITITGLRPLTNETVRVRACNATGSCSAEFVRVFQTNVGAPSAVRNLTPSVINRTNPVFSWEAPKEHNGPLDGYQVYLVDTTKPDVKDNQTLDSSQTTYQFNTTEEFERYAVTVMAFNVDLDDDTNLIFGDAAKKIYTTSGYSAPKPNVAQFATNTTSFELEWDRPNHKDYNITWYRVEIPDRQLDYFTQETSLSIHGLKPYTKIPVRVHSCTEEKADECGQPRYFDGMTDSWVPSVPRLLVASAVNESSALLKWKFPETPNGKINGYKFALMETANSTSNVTWTDLPGDWLSYRVTGLATGVQYTVQLRAFNENLLFDELESDTVSIKFTTAGPSAAGFPVWLIAVIIVVLVAGVVAGAFIYRRQRAPSDDTNRLVSA